MRALLIAAAAALGAVPPSLAVGQTALGSKPNLAAAHDHLMRAKAIAGADLREHYTWRCITDEIFEKAADAFQNAPAPVAPAKVFDNVHFVGLHSVSAWAVRTSDGIVLFDALNSPEDAKATIVGGLEKLGLDPRTIRYVVVTHGHGDHFGGAKYLKDTYGARIVASDLDWGVMERAKSGTGGGPGRWATLVPDRDLTVGENDTLKVGDQTFLFYLTPGHTPGTLTTIFKTTDRGQPHTVGLFGGFGTPRTVENKRTLIASLDRFGGIAKAKGVDVLLANHQVQDGSLSKIEELRLRGPTNSNPLVIGTDAYVRYLQVQKECTLFRMARAGQL